MTGECGEGGDNVTVELVTALEEVLDILEVTEVVAMESTPETIVGEEGGDGVDYVIPKTMLVTMEPWEEVRILTSCIILKWDIFCVPNIYWDLNGENICVPNANWNA